MEAETGFELSRFLEAQQPMYAQALDELRQGRKRSHWMWFIFPQLEGLGRSPTARHFGVKSLAEARAYLAHPVLGDRLRTVTQAVLEHRGVGLSDIFGQPDDLKFRSSMTLFAKATGPEDAALFRRALDVFCSGQVDPMTLRLLED